MRRYALAALAALFMFTATAAPTSAHSDPNYTGVEDITGNGSVQIERGGRYYMAAISHRGGYLGEQINTKRPTVRYVGVNAYKTNGPFGGLATPDWTLIDMGTVRHSPRAKVAGSYTFTTPRDRKLVYGETQTTPAPIGPDWAWGTELCFTAWPADGHVSKVPRVKCGYADNSATGRDRCNDPAPMCGMRSHDGSALIQGGDSGGLVWAPMPHGQVRPIGLLTVALDSYRAAGFQPFYGLTRHSFATSETLAGYPTGPGGRVVTG